MDAGARALMGFGRQIEQGAQEIYQAQKVEQDRMDTLRAEEAFTALREQQLDLTHGEENGFVRLKGADAVNRKLLPEYGKRFADAEAQIAGTLANDEQRRRFKARAGVASLQFNEGILRHLEREGDVYATQVYEGIVTTEQRNAVAKWDSPNDIEISLSRIDAAIEERAERGGWSAEYKGAIRKKEAGKVHAAVVQRALASGDYLYAQEWANEYKDDIDLVTAKAVERAVEDGTQKHIYATLNREFLGVRDDIGGLKELQKKIESEEVLDPTRKNSLLAQTLSRIGVLENQRSSADARAAQAVQQGIKEVNDNTLRGFPLQPGQIEPFVAAARGNPALEEQVRGAERLAMATQGFVNTHPLNQEKLIAGMEAAARADPSKVDIKVLDAFRAIAAQQKDRREKDPYLYGVQQGLIEQPIPVDPAAPADSSKNAWADRIGFARFMTREYGAPMKPLSTGEVEIMKDALKKTGPEGKRAYFAALAQGIGDDYEGYSAVMGQLAPDDPVAAQAGLFAFRGRTEAADLMLKGQHILHPIRTTDGTPDKGKLWTLPPETETRKAFQAYEANAFAERPQTRNAMYQAAQAIYAAKTVEAGDASGVLDHDRWGEAMRLSTGGITTYNGRGTILPYGYTESHFKSELARRVDELILRKQVADGVTRESLLDLPLRPIGDGRYVFVAGDGVLSAPAAKGAAHQPIVLDFNTAAPYRPSGSTAARVPDAEGPARRQQKALPTRFPAGPKPTLQ